MDPFTLALATFGVQKLRGKSTKRSLRDAFLVGGGSQLFSMSSLPGSSMISGFGSGAGKIPFSMSGIKEGTTAGRGLTSLLGNKAVAAKEATDTAAAVEGVEGSGFMGMSPFAKLATVTTAAPLVEAMFSDDKPEEPPFSEQDYKDAYARESGKLEGAFVPATQDANYNPFPNANTFYAAQGGIAEIKKFNEGGVQYLPSKIVKDEKDYSLYERAGGYIEDETGMGNKDKDTMLAQLADGEFVSRADAILGAGIMSGASPSDFKDMRAKGAKFFYNQQSQLKRIYELTDGAKQTKN
jgi:hypothetical protein